MFLRDKVPSAEMRERLEIELVTEDVKRIQFRWLG